MAETIKTYVSDGSTTIYTFEFDYISKEFVKVLVDGVEVPRTLSGTYQVTLDEAPAAGAVITITRQTATDRIVEFVDGSVLVAKDLNLSALQATHIAAEALAAASGSLLIDETGAFSAGGRRITQVGDPTAAEDVANKGWIEAQGNGFVQLSTAAQNAAQTAQAASEAARDSANAHKNTAKAHKDNAQAAQAASEAARDTALDHANTANTHKVAAQAAQTGAEAARDETQTLRDEIGDLRTDGAAAVAEATRQAGFAAGHADDADLSAQAAAQSAIDAANAAGFDPADYAAAVHGHAIAEIAGLQAELDTILTQPDADGRYVSLSGGNTIAGGNTFNGANTFTSAVTITAASTLGLIFERGSTGRVSLGVFDASPNLQFRVDNSPVGVFPVGPADGNNHFMKRQDCDDRYFQKSDAQVPVVSASAGYAQVTLQDADGNTGADFLLSDSDHKAFINTHNADGSYAQSFQFDVTGDLPHPNSVLRRATADGRYGVRTVSTAAPSGGSDGDVWFQVE